MVNLRNSGPCVRSSPTSRAAGRHMRRRAGRLGVRVLDFLIARGPTGATDTVQQEHMSLDGSTPTPAAGPPRHPFRPLAVHGLGPASDGLDLPRLRGGRGGYSVKSQKIPTRRWLSALFELPSFRKAPATAMRVLLVLVRHRNGTTGLTFPLQSTIAKTLGIHRQSVTRAIKWLVENDIIVCERLWHEGRTRKVCRLPFLDELENQGSASAAGVATPALRRS